jgi:hypothetical protein
MTSVVWVHGDSLSSASAALSASPERPAIFVFDNQLIADYGLSFKRIVFLYECLLEMPVVIRRGDIATEVLAFAIENEAEQVATTRSPSPYFGQVLQRLQQETKVVVHEEPPFALDQRYDLGRYSRYWSKAQASVMDHQ